MQRRVIMQLQRGSHQWWVRSVCCWIFLVVTSSVQAEPLSKKEEEHKMSRTPAQQYMETAARTYFERVTKGDVNGILDLFADDAQIINPMTGEQGIRGKEALRAFYTNLVGRRRAVPPTL